MDLASMIPPDWREVLAEEVAAPSFRQLETFVAGEYESTTCYPPRERIFHALVQTPFEAVRVLLLGQDPYHGEGQAHGLCFSVPRGVEPPPSLRNIFRELHADLGCAVPAHGELTAWSQRGVLLLNTVLTVRAGEPASHAKRGWEEFTDGIIRKLSARKRPVVFLLWGSHARKKAKQIDASRHAVLEAGHPSPLSQQYFFGSRPFSGANQALEARGEPPLDWCLDADAG